MDAAAVLPDLIRAARLGPAAVLDAVAPSLRALGFIERRTAKEPTATLWTRGAPKLLFSGHVDVVPNGDGWTRDPHGGDVTEGRVWGRGACDMLGALACFIGAASLRRDLPCGILLTTDEETRMNAVEIALDEGFLAGFEGVIVGEPTGFAVGIAEKGVFWLRLHTEGRNAHGSMPELGDNAADRLVRVLAELQRVKLDGRHPLLGAPTKNLGRLWAGEAVNQVPASASAEIDLRYLPGMTQAQVLGLIESAARRAGERIRIEVLSDHVPFEVDADSPLVLRARRAVAAARSHEAPVILGLPYGTEASKFAPRGIPCVILGPGEPALAHTNRESILLSSLADGERMYAALLEPAA